MERAQDAMLMRKALRLARKGLGHCSPNPAVGAVVLGASGKVAGKGFHLETGLSHAEVVALDQAGNRARNGTLYVTLEPCTHWGKTPPCVDRVLASGVSRVVVAMRDPNPGVKGEGAARLREAGLEVVEGVLEGAARELIRGFTKRVTTGLPWFILKTAMSLDGKIATRTHQSRWISSPQSRLRAHRIRGESDAILTSWRTVALDDPSLTVRLPGRKEQFKRIVVVDALAQSPLTAKVFLTRPANKPPILITTSMAPVPVTKAFEGRGIEVVRMGQGPRIDLKALAKFLGTLGINSVLIEAGGGLNASFVELGLVDEFHFFIAPMILAGQEAPTVADGRGVEAVAQGRRLTYRRVQRLGPDLWVECRPEGE